MFLEIEDETRDFVTIYKKDFLGTGTEKRREYRPKSTYPPPLNLLNGPYKKRLNTRRKNLSLPLEEQTEDPQENLNKIRDKYPRLKNILPEAVPDEDLVDQKENELLQTIYISDYSKGNFYVNLGDYSSRVNIYARWKDIRLPENWVISETVQRKSYRNPWKIASDHLLRTARAEKPPDNLVPSEKEREILRTRTGDSEYDATIAASGNKIIKEKLLGEPLPVEPKIYIKGPDSPRSECSQVSAEKKLVLPSNIF
ncbi:PREDICTED: uncharacterized protein LOC107185749 [Dufourea novaeangliae]|uniref:uncharacterized protein LOC107185749 n=1 Tax=Dufourea novaeangliae TaxID=178035 RepID=UPI000766FEDA|nr:PREDICTED: uncharacterized protein LOC107185749 [Dufourea novaeangliae]